MDKLSEILQETLSSTNDWVQFAETKNSVLVAACGVAIWGILRLIAVREPSLLLTIYFFMAISFMGIAFLLSLISFLPNLRHRWVISYTPPQTRRNLLYFGHLASLTEKELIDLYCKAMRFNEEDVSPLHEMYAEQVIINSRIALVKYKLFEWSVKLTICGLLTPIIAVAVFVLIGKKMKKVE